MDTYNTKVVDYGYKEKVSVYSKAIAYDKENGNSSPRQKYADMSERKKAMSDARRIRYYKKAVAELIEIALMNEDLNIMLTLTFRDDVKSYDIAVAEWESFLKRLRYYMGDKPLKYICVWEYQRNRGNVFHFHCLLNTGFIEHEDIEKIWNKGYVWIKKLSSDKKRFAAIRYTTKYCVKEIVARIENNEDIRGQRFYFISNNLIKPTIHKYGGAMQIEDIIIEHLEDIICDGSYLIKDCYGKPLNKVDYVEYKK